MNTKTISIPVPTLPADYKSTVLGLIGGIGLFLQRYLKTGTFDYETIIIAVLVIVFGYLMGKEASPAMVQTITSTIEGIVNNVLGSKIPAILTQAQATNAIEQAATDAVVAVTGADTSDEPAAAAPAADGAAETAASPAS